MRASRSKRSRDSALPARRGGRILTATMRFSLVSRAFHTSPIPPAPMGERISYGPSLSPTERGILMSQLSLTHPVVDSSWVTAHPDRTKLGKSSDHTTTRVRAMASCLAPAKLQASSVCWLQSVLLQSRQVLRLYHRADGSGQIGR